jgi:hypothetical protein
MIKTRRVSVTERALILRINRALRPDRVLKTTHPGTLREEEVGRYYILRGNTLDRDHVNLVALAKELGCLEGFEELAST